MVMTASAMRTPSHVDIGHVGQIPVRNLWLLMLYASELFRHLGKRPTAVEENPDDIPDLVAEFLAHAVEHRIKRNLSFGYQARNANLGRVRGRIDLLKTERHQLLSRGMVACRFDDLTVNTPRNRFVRSALQLIATIVRRDELAHRCLALAGSLQQLGVTGEKPSRTDIVADRFGRHDAGDRIMVAAAQLAYELALPTEIAGTDLFVSPDRDVDWVRHLFEKAVGGFYRVVLQSRGWSVRTGKTMHWQIGRKTAGIDKIMPAMCADIVLDHVSTSRRIIIDTKFNSILTSGWYRQNSLRSGYIYQIYTYLRSQEGNGDSLSDHASGLLLHPAVEEMVDEAITIQCHIIRFATVDLCATAGEIRKQLQRVVVFNDD